MGALGPHVDQGLARPETGRFEQVLDSDLGFANVLLRRETFARCAFMVELKPILLLGTLILDLEPVDEDRVAGVPATINR